MGYKLGYHILVLPNQALIINSVLTNEVLLYCNIISIIYVACKLCMHEILCTINAYSVIVIIILFSTSISVGTKATVK